ncbi:LOW QUALITY PROTEIN: OTU domain-containing protein 1 [Anoplopoma fimbria]|uniref:LOW QUALITY PROTEIN: OTU domain-containing protein 1 n=1 Tax=Anoplopoma fimbria TaxID=229290 RepID=UPI0023EDDEA3|nr:LOW QUALITY PROTEIN: OTU domain-containing protein 1 [Anoplopoma fimbria]
MLLSSFRNSPAATFGIKETPSKMQLYNSVLTHYPRSSRKVTITLSTGPERLNGNAPSSSDAHKPGFTQPGSTPTTNRDPVRQAASSANMQAFSCYKPSSMRPVYFTSTAEILIRRPDGVERSVPVHIMRESRTKPCSPDSRNGERILYEDCDSDVIVDLIDQLRNGREELVGNHFFNRNNMCGPRREESEKVVGNSSEEDTDSVAHAPFRSNGWDSLHEGELVPSRAEDPEGLIKEDFRDQSSGKAAPASDERRAFELSVLQESPPRRCREPEDVNNKVTRYLAEVEKQNKYLQERHKYRYHIIPDGNCLYRAVCKATYGDQARHGELREQTVHHIADHLEEFNPIIEGDVGEFLINAAQDGAWAGYPELLAMSQMLNVHIHLTTGGSSESPTVSTMVHYLGGEEDASKGAMWLSWLSNGHYDVILDKCLPNPEYEDWCRQSQMQRKRDEELAKSMAASLSKMYIEQNGSA